MNDRPKIPGRWHRCRAVVARWSNLDYVEECACGAARLNGGLWLGRNAARRSQ